jgi:hypothetical protein
LLDPSGDSRKAIERAATGVALRTDARDMDAATEDEVSITTDGRRLVSVEAVMDFVREVALERAAAERAR